MPGRAPPSGDDHARPARPDAAAAEAASTDRNPARREVLAEIVDAQEAERARIARDLHDDVGQALTSVLLGIGLIGRALGTEPRVDEARDRVEDLRDVVADALDRTRQLAFDLRPTVLDDIGLVPTLERLAGDLAGRTGLAVEIGNELPDERLARPVETVLYRVVQEALTNVARHAHASTARVALTRRRDSVRAVISDDGRGFDTVDGTRHVGIDGMAERARLVGGDLDIASAVGAGTRVTLEIPLD